MAMKIQFVVFWVVTPCNDVVGYQRFGGSCCLHLHPKAGSSMVLHITALRHNPQDHNLYSRFGLMLILTSLHNTNAVIVNYIRPHLLQ